ncbi:MAG: hypothetical protein O3A13_09155 [Proteobacteria bacterium]|nr:hypothetical protein [Pseudomonadota bacterium]
MNKFLKILVGILSLVALGLGSVFYFTSDMVRTADDFFLATKNGDIAAAYSFLSEDFQASTSQSELSTFAQSNRLTEFQEANWQNRSVSGGRGELVGSITTTSGGVVPISLSLVKGDNSWKIYAIQKPATGLQVESASFQMPSASDQVDLARTTMHVFAESVNDRSMKAFFEHTSNLWQKQTTIEDLDQAFAVFYEFGADLTVLDNFSPGFDPEPSVDENGILLLSGYYPTKPTQVHFEQKYVYEGLGWKLVGFSTNIK